MYFVSICLIAYLLSAQKAESAEIVELPNIKVYAFEKILYRWGDKQWTYFSALVDKESKWDNLADNPNSTAFGIGQFLDSTWKSVGCEKTYDQYAQVDCMLDYIELRYNSPKNALTYHNKMGWY